MTLIPGLHDLGGGALLGKGGGLAVDGPPLLGLHGPFSSMGLAQDVKHPAQGLLPHGGLDGVAGGGDLHPPANPSLGESMMQRTVSPPMCWATSITCWVSPRVTVMASLISGSLPSGKTTSTTGPKHLRHCAFPFHCDFLPFYGRLPSARKRTVRAGVSSRRGGRSAAFRWAPPTTSVISWVMAACRARL